MKRAAVRVAWCLLSAGFVAFAASPADARPQISAQATTGLALTDLRAPNAPRLAYHLGGRFDFLFRERPGAQGFGPYLDIATEAFDTLEMGGGLAWLVPVDKDDKHDGATAFLFSVGGFARDSRFGWNPGVSASVFWGLHSFNYHSAYSLGLGLFAEGRYGFGAGDQLDAIGGLRVDLGVLALPFLFAYQALTH